MDILNLLAVLAAALGAGWVARRLGYPSILGELAAGIILGPPLLGLLHGSEALGVLGELGVLLLMLYIGLHLDPSSIGRAAKPGALAAFGGFIVPAGLGFGLMMLVDGDPIAAAFVAVAMGVTSLATKSRILVDLGILNTRIAHVLMAGALASDIAALVLFSALLGVAAAGTVAVGSIALTGLLVALFGLGAWIVGTWLFPIIGRWLSRRSVDPTVRFLVVVCIGLAFAEAAHLVGLHGILGAFLAGLFIREGILPRDQQADLEHKAHLVSVGLLAPIFFVTAGFDVSFSVFVDAPGLLVGTVVLATVGKVFGTALFYLPTGYGFREGVAVGAGMNGRGAVEIIVAELALASGLIDTTVFSILVFMAIFTTATVPVLLTRSIEWLRRRGELVSDDRTGVVILGAGPIARLVAGLLDRPGEVRFIDTNAENTAAAERDRYEVVKGSVLDEGVLEGARIAEASTFIAMTGNAEVNLLAAQVASASFGVPELHLAVGGGAPAALADLMRPLGAVALFDRPVDLTAWELAAEEGRVATRSYPVTDVGLTFDQMAEADDAMLPAVVVTRSGAVLYHGGRVLEPGDEVFALVMGDGHERAYPGVDAAPAEA